MVNIRKMNERKGVREIFIQSKYQNIYVHVYFSSSSSSRHICVCLSFSFVPFVLHTSYDSFSLQLMMKSQRFIPPSYRGQISISIFYSFDNLVLKKEEENTNSNT